MATAKYGPEAQRVPVDAPLKDIIILLKRDGVVVIKKFLPYFSIDKAYDEIRPKMEIDRE